MLFNFSKDVQSGVQRAQSVFAGNARRAPRGNTFQEIFHFELQRFGLFYRKILKADLLRRRYRERRGLLALIVKRNVLAGLEQPQLPHPLRRDAAGGQVGDAAVGERQPYVGNVYFVGKDADARRANLGRRCSYHREHDVQVVDHQVQHHVHVQAARAEQTQPVDLEKQGSGLDQVQSRDRRVEAFQMPRLQDAAVTRSRVHQSFTRRIVGGDGLFHHHVDALLQQLAADLGMKGGGSRHHGSIDLAKEPFDRRDDGAIEFAGNGFGALSVGIDQTYQLRPWRLLQNSDMMASENARANHGYTDLRWMVRQIPTVTHGRRPAILKTMRRNLALLILGLPLFAQQPPPDSRPDQILKEVDDLMWNLKLGDIAEVDRVEYTSLPPAHVANPKAPGATNPLIIRAYTFIPKNLDRSKKQPLIVFAHQGIHANFDTRDLHLMRELISQGYSVIAPDYRGSTGYGRQFYEQIDYGGREVDDVFLGTQWMLEAYSFLDPKRVGMLGWSHGGLITLMNILQHPHVYAAAYAGVPVTDLVARLGYEPEGYRALYSAPYHIGKPVREDIAEYRKRSPVTYAKNLETPLLIHGNTNDEDVNVLEIEHMIDALKASGKKFESKIYEDAPGGHYFNRTDTRLARESRREVYKFLAQYLHPQNPVN
jgi:dienelactone hydrolase